MDVSGQPPVKGRLNKSKASCCVPGCCRTGYLVEGDHVITFHSIPLTNRRRLNVWVDKINRRAGDKITISRHTKICSRHFLKSDFLTSRKGRRFLKSNATPSIFSCADEPKASQARARNSDAHRGVAGPVSVCEDEFQLNRCEQQIIELQKEVAELKYQLSVQRQAAELFQKERDCLKELLQAEKRNKYGFSLEQIIGDDKLVAFYTGFHSSDELEDCFTELDPGEKGIDIFRGDNLDNETNRKTSSKSHKLELKDEFLLVLIRLRLGLLEEDLAFRFRITKHSVNHIWLSWLNYMYCKFSQINIWPTEAEIQRTMPVLMKEKYPRLEWIIDAFEIKTEKPSSLALQSEGSSRYKSAPMLKGLLACTPSGQVGFVSLLHHGNITDVELIESSGFLQRKHNKGATWLVGRGFTIQDLVAPLGVKVIMLDLVEEWSHLFPEEVERVRIERVINKVKDFHIFDAPIPPSMYGTISQVWTICAYMTLFQNSILSA